MACGTVPVLPLGAHLRPAVCPYFSDGTELEIVQLGAQEDAPDARRVPATATC